MNTRRTAATLAAAVTIGAAAAATTVTAPAAQAASLGKPRVTVVWTPHQDDEVLAGAGYINFAAARGDDLWLIAVTDGEASSLGKRRGMTEAQVKAVRTAEQNAAWAHLTNGRGRPIIRLRLPDAGVTDAAVRTRVAAIHRQVQRPGMATEYYAAASVLDAHPDHRAVARGLAAGLHKSITNRNLKPAGFNAYGTRYLPPSHAAAHAAWAAYAPFGHDSVRAMFNVHEATDHVSRVTAFGK